MEKMVVNPDFSMRFDTTSGNRIFLDIANGQAQGTIVLTRNPDGSLAIYLRRNTGYAHEPIGKRSFIAVWYLALWKLVFAAVSLRGVKRLSTSG